MDRLKGRLTISKVMGRGGEVRISLEDENSCCPILEARCDVTTFGDMLFGLAYQSVEYSISNADKAGLVREIKPLEFRMQDCDYSKREDMASEVAQSHADDGWIASCSFSSQSSFERDGDELICRTHQYRFVEPTEAKP